MKILYIIINVRAARLLASAMYSREYIRHLNVVIRQVNNVKLHNALNQA